MLSRTKPLMTVRARSPAGALSPVSLALATAGFAPAFELSPAALRAPLCAPALAAARAETRSSTGTERDMGDRGSAFQQGHGGAVADGELGGAVGRRHPSSK
jgi:hypothetical protein